MVFEKWDTNGQENAERKQMVDHGVVIDIDVCS